MTIHLPNDLELSLEAVVNSGRFASLDDAMAEAARRLLRELGPMEKGLALANTDDSHADRHRRVHQHADDLQESPDEWVLRLQAWVNTHPSRPVTIEDSRESIYAGRGE